jgi:hypothetical protein
MTRSAKSLVVSGMVLQAYERLAAFFKRYERLAA